MTMEQAAEEIKALLTEAEFTARWQIIEAHHEVGKIILQLEGERTKIVHMLAVKLDRSERTLWYAVKFAQTFKKVDDVPEGKNVSMNLVIRKYLTEPKEIQDCNHLPITICRICRVVLDRI